MAFCAYGLYYSDAPESLLGILRDRLKDDGRIVVVGPFGPNNNLYGLINTYRIKAGIAMPAQQRHGLHSLRHTLASSLLEQHIALPTITAIMGHLDSGSTQISLKVDLAQLRQCALESGEATDATA